MTGGRIPRQASGPDGWQHSLGRLSRDLEEASGTPAVDLAALSADLLRESRTRASLFGGACPGDPVWNLLLDLLVNQERGKLVIVSAACAASGAPLTTAHRHLRLLERREIVSVAKDRNDRRRAYVSLTPTAREALIEHLLRSYAGQPHASAAALAPEQAC